MSDSDGGSAELRAEIAAFYAGFGQPEVLRQVFADSPLIVPLLHEDRLCMVRVGEIDWICAFTDVREYARYMTVRGVESDGEYRYHTLLGRRLAEYAASRPHPTGVAVDPSGDTPIAFPPEVSAEPDSRQAV